MGKIATWSFLNSKFGTSGSPTNKCPRKSDIEATGKVKISGSYSSNQLVQEADCASASTTKNYTYGLIRCPGSQSILIQTLRILLRVNNGANDDYSLETGGGLSVGDTRTAIIPLPTGCSLDVIKVTFNTIDVSVNNVGMSLIASSYPSSTWAGYGTSIAKMDSRVLGIQIRW